MTPPRTAPRMPATALLVPYIALASRFGKNLVRFGGLGAGGDGKVEVMALDRRSVDLAVLSACDTVPALFGIGSG